MAMFDTAAWNKLPFPLKKDQNQSKQEKYKGGIAEEGERGLPVS